MNKTTLVKLAGINNLSDARFAAAAGVSYLGFCFDPDSPHYVPPIKARDMMGWISGPHFVAEFGNQSPEEIRDICELLPIDIVEMDNDLLSDELKQYGKPAIKKLDSSSLSYDQILTTIHAYAQSVDAFLLHQKGVAHTLSADQLKSLCSRYQIIWGLPVNKDTVVMVMEQFSPYAIQLDGGDEERPGIKDFDELADLLEIIIPQEGY